MKLLKFLLLAFIFVSVNTNAMIVSPEIAEAKFGNNITYIKKTAIEITQISKKDLECLAKNIYYESRGQPEKGQYGVAYVTMNRVNSGKFPTNVCAVVNQKVGKVCQFSWVCLLANSKKIINDKISFSKSQEIALNVLQNYYNKSIKDPTNGALFFAEKNVFKNTLSKFKITTRIGDHVFYNRK